MAACRGVAVRVCHPKIALHRLSGGEIRISFREFRISVERHQNLTSDSFRHGGLLLTSLEFSKKTVPKICTPATLSRSRRSIAHGNRANDVVVESNTQTSGKSSHLERKLSNGPSFEHFLANINDGSGSKSVASSEVIPYLNKSLWSGRGKKVYFETYGCQMNVNDTDIAWSILKQNHFQRTPELSQADVVLLITCSIREGAETKIWNRLRHLRTIKKRRPRGENKSPLKIGLLGCMAERLKADLLEKEHLVDVVCGPDAYKDLPRLLSVTASGQTAINVQLSLEETYADIVPVRISESSPSAFVSIMRGCDNMCSYCIVPFTRGRERSRPVTSILEEIRYLSDKGVKEVTLLGQNVNSYRDISETIYHRNKTTVLPPGFKTVYKAKSGGQRFADLLDKVSLIDPEMRIRFTSPHPKDFPDEVLQLIRDRPNICNQLHIPAQSGNSETLKAMRRGYTREAYLDLIQHIRHILPDVALSSDFIAGFCGETEEAHQDTLSLMRQVQYNFVFCFPYSMRQKTHASHRLKDDVPVEVKARRHLELTNEFRLIAERLNLSQIGQQQLVLIEGDSKKSSQDLAGRNDANTKVILPKVEVPSVDGHDSMRALQPGDYVVVQVNAATSQTLKGIPLYYTTLQDFHSHLPIYQPWYDATSCSTAYV
ncbi:mitochondrial tRNA methylthiotransferase CDK5RAP1-like [Liolophura sinensis]|uniref:mitochondrial tRNA methylthiotransferase CDK5RAP1-like n=1 Tax=Liolophura sinensis TaxID=3198878 RepID=UPI0031587920